ncbi:MAG: response regulator transcription factor [Betaproteobacteria bacterium]|nr:MAG: response regulator transcription factor [Betaproteobacteria bacterium]
MKVLLIDDHPLILSALQSVIRGMGENVSVTGAASARAGREILKRDSDFDLVLLDLQLGDADGFEVLAEFRAAYPAVPVVVVSASDSNDDVVRAIDLGAMGFVPKRASNDTLCEALRMVMSGGIYVPQTSLLAARSDSGSSLGTLPGALDALRQNTSDSDFPATQPGLDSLGITPRQHEVLALLLQGKPNKMIARELGVSVDTVKDHVAAVLRALRVDSRTQAVLAVSQMAQQPGWPRSK